MIKLEVSTHSGETDILEVEEFDAEEMTELRNGDDEAIAIGNHSYSRIDIKNVKPVKEVDEELVNPEDKNEPINNDEQLENAE